MYAKDECVAMLLAGGQGKRLAALTEKLAKPAVAFGGKYRIIDFTLSNCSNSGIGTVGVLTQYEPLVLSEYIGSGAPWDLDRPFGGVTVLPPYQNKDGGRWYAGTADAVWQNMDFIRRRSPKYVLILSGDHVYKMDYSKMIMFHRESGAEATVAAISVPRNEASRFGILSADSAGRITDFEEKPAEPKGELASMGIYVFTPAVLEEYLACDAVDENSAHDFGRDIIPAMLAEGRRLYAYRFDGYWKDVGTVESLWDANMDLLGEHPGLDLSDPKWRIYSRTAPNPPHFIGGEAKVKNSLVTEGCAVDGTVENCVLSPGVRVERGAVVRDSVLMSGVTVKSGATVSRAIVDSGTTVAADAVVGDPGGIFVFSGAANAPGQSVPAPRRFAPGAGQGSSPISGRHNAAGHDPASGAFAG